MLIGLVLILVAIALLCALPVRLSIYALPLFVAAAVASATHPSGGMVASLVAAAVAAIATIAIAQIALGLVKSNLARAGIGVVFAVPAAIAGYRAVHGTVVATMPDSGLQISLSLLGSAITAAASSMQWGRVPR